HPPTSPTRRSSDLTHIVHQPLLRCIHQIGRQQQHTVGTHFTRQGGLLNSRTHTASGPGHDRGTTRRHLHRAPHHGRMLSSRQSMDLTGAAGSKHPAGTVLHPRGNVLGEDGLVDIALAVERGQGKEKDAVELHLLLLFLCQMTYCTCRRAMVAMTSSPSACQTCSLKISTSMSPS